jgi:imidazolonepropionase
MTIKLFRNAKIYTPIDKGHPKRGPEQNHMEVYENGILLVKNGQIVGIGDASHLMKGFSSLPLDQEIDCQERCMIPGFVDPHTHLCFARRREAEFNMRIAGTPYLEILNQGGGILSSVRAVHEASESELLNNTLQHAFSALSFGTTTVEIKSGYGLDTINELKMLRVIEQIGRMTPLDVVPTFLGAHAIPEAFRGRTDDFVDLVIEEMLPAVEKQKIATFCDVFCEKGVFSIAQGRKILAAAQGRGLGIKIHADEVHDLGGASLAADLQAISADHLLAAGTDSIKKMVKSGVVANLLPATAYSLQKPYARAREMINAGLPVALATDCNPGSSYTESMPFVIGLAVINMMMTPFEALTGATLNAAYAIGMADRVGSLDVGKQADFLLLDGDTPAIIAYHAGVNPVVSVYKRGEMVRSNEQMASVLISRLVCC